MGLWPKTTDTLMLQFRTASDTNWNTVWYRLGYEPKVDTDTMFHLVMIPFDTGQYFKSLGQLNNYLKNGFQFRFKAYACGSADADHWNIDEVYLNAFRNYTDTMQDDIAFGYEAPSLLANYTQEPWEQFQASDWRTTNMNMYERNNNASYLSSSLNEINATYQYFVNSQSLATSIFYSGGADNVFPFVDFPVRGKGWNDNLSQCSPPLINTSNLPASLTGPTVDTVTHVISGNAGDFDKWNDTLRFYQYFYNNYAYDDGSAECAYFINGYPFVPTFLAYQFTLNKPDTVFGINIYFDYLFVNANQYAFRLCLWDDTLGGQPGKLLYEDTVMAPVYDFQGQDEFTTYYFNAGRVLPAGKFYIGWEQTVGDSINIGYDFSANTGSKLFWCIDTKTWYPSSLNGTAMIRPIVGKPSEYVGINNIKTPETDIIIYPNPAQNELHLSSDLKNSLIRIMAEDGKIVYENEHFSGNAVNTSYLPNGFYIVEVTTPGKATSFRKLMIER